MMRKKLTILVVGIIGVLVMGAGLLLFRLDPLIEQFRPQIAQLISDAVGQPVSIGEIRGRVLPQTTVEVNNVSINGSAGEGAASLGKLELHAKIGPLLKGKLAIDEASLTDLAIKIVRDATGKFHVGGIPIVTGRKKSQPLAVSSVDDVHLHRAAATVSDVPPKNGPAADEKKIAVQVERISLKNTQLTFEDQTTLPPAVISLAGLEGKLTDINPAGSASVDLSGRLLNSAQTNFKLNGVIGNPAGNFPFDVKLELSSLSLDEASKILNAYRRPVDASKLSGPVSATLRLRSVEGKIETTFAFDGDKAAIEMPNTLVKAANDPFNAQVEAISTLGGKVDFKNLSAKVGAPNGKPVMSALPWLSLDRLTGSIASTEREVALRKFVGRINNQPFDLDMKLSPSMEAGYGQPTVAALLHSDQFDGLQFIPQTTAAQLQALTFNKLTVLSKYSVSNKSGTVSITADNATITKIAASQLKADLNLLPTQLGFQVRSGKGEIKEFNILRETLGQLDQIPGVQGKLIGVIPEEYRPLLAEDATGFDTITLDGTFQSGRVNFTSVSLVHSLYKLTGSGWIVPGGDLEIKAQFGLTPKLTEGMIAKQAAIKFLLDRDSRLVIPIVVTKRDGRLIVLPDVSRLTQLGLKNAATTEASKALKKVPGLGDATKILDKLF